MNEKDLINHYKKQLADSEEKAPDGLWSDIERKLDLEEVWDHVSTRLDNDKKRKFYWLLPAQAAGIAGIILVTGLAINELLDFNRNEQIIAGDNTEVQTGTNDTIQPLTVARPYSGLALADPALPVELDSHVANYNIHVETVSLGSENQIDTFDHRDRIIETETNNLLGHLPASVDQIAGDYRTITGDNNIEGTDFALLLINLDAEPTADNNFFIPKPYGLSLGVTTAIKNTWLMNTETALALDGDNGSRTGLNFFSDFSVSLRYNLSPRWGFKSNLSLYSNTGQSYQQFIYGRFSQREIELNYMHFDLAATHRHKNTTIIGSLQLGHTTSLGMYIASLNHAHETIAGVKQNITNQYRDMDFGILAGHEIDIFLHPRLALSPGLFVNWGLPNIYTGEHNTISPINRTFNFSFDFRVALYYNLIVQ